MTTQSPDAFSSNRSISTPTGPRREGQPPWNTQRNSSMPGAPSDAVRDSQVSKFSRIIRQHVCQPDAQSPPNIECLAASSSRWKGCGS